MRVSVPLIQNKIVCMQEETSPSSQPIQSVTSIMLSLMLVYPIPIDLLQFGQMKADLTDIMEGYLWGNWPSGEATSYYWIGFPVRKTPTYAWAGLPAFNDNFNRNIWKHQCFTLDFSTGKFKYFLNGIKKFK
jgi:hypothetical protein